MEIAILGLGKMGSRIAKKLLQEGHEVALWNRSEEPLLELTIEIRESKIKHADKKLKVGSSIENVIFQLQAPRVIWLMLPAGDATDEVLTEVEKFVEEGDIVIDGGNSKFTDTQKRFERLAEKKIRFLGIGVSGGVIAAENGYPLMVGGDESAYQEVQPILDALSKPHGGHDYFGTGGAGHYVKMVHNAIEYAYMQGIGEGFGVLEKAPYRFDLVQIAKIYQRGSLISGFMMDRTVEALTADPHLKSFSGVMGSASGETAWTVEEAQKKELPIDVIKRAFLLRRASLKNKKIQETFAAKMVQALRLAFGGHTEKK